MGTTNELRRSRVAVSETHLIQGGHEAARLADGYFYALDARTGQQLWQMALAGSVHASPISYAVGGKQYIAVAAGNTLFAFALRQ